MASTVNRAAWGTGLLLAACNVSPSRAPLGGAYAAPDSVAAKGPHLAPVASVTVADDAGSAPEAAKPVALTSVPSAALDAGAPVVTLSSADAVRYDPLKAGDRVLANVNLEANGELLGGPPGGLANNKVLLGMQHKVELRVIAASVQRLEELELTITPLSAHSEFGGHVTDSKSSPPETFEVTLSGRSPSVRAKHGSKVDAADRALLSALVLPLAEFHARWSTGSSFELKSGWSARTPLPVASLFEEPGDKLQVGPFLARFDGRDLATDNVPFQIALPIAFSTDEGKIDFDLKGAVVLGAKRGRPTRLDLSGPLHANGGPGGNTLSIVGTTKLSATLSYP